MVEAAVTEVEGNSLTVVSVLTVLVDVIVLYTADVVDTLGV